mmetsp:Transcript_2449/g.7547  ORF Transcript_2449/g.7547 Transcript_2449/m.7547 type:complete len:102 (+) Transcript_2449:233-538(+)
MAVGNGVTSELSLELRPVRKDATLFVIAVTDTAELAPPMRREIVEKENDDEDGNGRGLLGDAESTLRSAGNLLLVCSAASVCCKMAVSKRASVSVFSSSAW